MKPQPISYQQVKPDIIFPTGSVLVGSEAQNRLIEFEKKETKIAMETIQDNDFQNQASEQGNVLLCDKIGDGKKKVLCRDTIFLQKTPLNNENIALPIESCWKIETISIRDNCYDKVFMTYAVRMKEDTYCDKISDSDMLLSCKNTLEKIKLENRSSTWRLDVSTCVSLNWVDQEYCQTEVKNELDTVIMDRAITEKNLEECEKIQNSELKQSCNDAILYERAMAEKNVDICLNLIDEWKRNTCQQQIVSMTDVNQLQSIVNAWNRDDCVKIGNEELRIKCSDLIILRVVAVTPNKELCSLVIDAAIKNQCLQVSGE